MAQLALAAGGAAIGFMVGGPVGAQIGWTAGAIIGTALDPNVTRGPTLTDLNVHISSYGKFITQIWGTIRTGGNVVWKTRLEPHESTSSVGKGFGNKVVNTTYTVSFQTLIGRSKRDGSERLLRMWAYGDLIYDGRTGTVVTGSELPFVFYNGAADQMPDPTIESIKGVGNVSARRGYLTVVFTDWDVTKWGTIPQLNFEISTNVEEQPLSRSATWEVQIPTTQPLTDHRAVDYDDDGNIRIAWWNTPTGAIPNFDTPAGSTTWRRETYDVDGTLLDTTDVVTVLPTGAVYLCRNESSLSYQARSGGGSRWYKNGVMVADQDVDGGTPSAYYSVNEEFIYYDGNVYSMGGNVGGAYLIRYPAPNAVPDPTYDIRYLIDAGSTGGQFTIQLSNDGHIYCNGSGVMHKFDADLNLITTWTGTFPNSLSFLPRGGWMVCSDKILIRIINGGDLTADYVLYQLNATLPWTEISRVDVLDPTPPGGGQLWSLGDGMVLVEDGMLSVCFIDAGTVLHGDIVADICEECGLDPSEFDVSELIDRERGVMTTQISTGRAFIESLMPIRFYDAVDSDTGIKFVKRGKASVVTIPDGDLAGRGENEEIPDKLEIIRGNDDELPSTLFLKYFNYNADYQIGTQPWRRQTGISKITQEVNVAMVLTDSEAKQIVDAWGAEIWNGRDKYKWTTLPKYLKYEPTDVQTVQSLELRVEKQQEHRAEGKITWEGIRSRPGNFAQPGVGGEAEGFPTQDIPEPQETELALIDGPFLDADPRQGLIPFVAQGALRRSWRGTALHKSLDGTNYSQIATEMVAGTIGETVTELGNYSGASFDEENALRVLIFPGGGELVSVTRAQAFAGENAAMVGAEYINYRTATLLSEDEHGKLYQLTGMLRGRRGTQWAMRGHLSGDSPPTRERFVALPPNQFLPLLRADIGRTRNYKAPTHGRTLASADVYPFRSNGIPLAPYAPAFPAAGFNSSGDVIMTWVRRSRVNPGWTNFYAPTGEGPPIGEETERYKVTVWTDGTYQTVANEYTVVAGDDFAIGTKPTFNYTSGMQDDDFGYPLGVLPAWSVAQIGSLGPGYDTLGRLPLVVPTTIPEYVPPNPEPADGTLSIMTWASAAQVQALSLGPNDQWHIQVTEAGGISSAAGDRPNLTAVEYTGAPIMREWTFSPTRGDFGPQPKPFASGQGFTVTQPFCVGTDTDTNYPTLALGATMYLNIRTLPTSYTSTPMICNLVNIP